MTLSDLIQRENNGVSHKYLMFWGHKPEPNGEIGVGCLSQWWPSTFLVEGVQYQSAEHFMMAEKARLFQDEQALADILSATHPAEAKKIGRRVRGFNPLTWADHRFEIVVRGNFEKFRQNEREGVFLRNTGDQVLVEASPRDRIWGIGMSKNHPNATQPSKWRGKNLLGFALMEARAQLRSQVWGSS